MILGYKNPPGEEAYYFGKVEGVDKKFRRVLAGIVMPVFDRERAGAVVVAELFRVNRDQDFTVVEHCIGDWIAVERALLEYDRNLQFRDAVVADDKERKLLWRIPWSQHVLTAHAPEWATKEIGRQKVDELIREGRLHLGAFEMAMGNEPDISARALQIAVCYALDWNPPYLTKTRKPIQARPLGAVGL